MGSFTQTIFLLLCCVCFARVSAQEMIRCNVPPVNSLQDTVLTCHFPEDLSVSKKDFTVYHYVQLGSPEAVVDCWWVRGSLDCYTKQGFDTKKTVSTTLNVTMSQVTSTHTGTYACQVAGYGANVLETCQLDLKLDEDNTCNVSDVLNDSQMTLTCFFNEDVQKTQTNFSVYRYNDQEKLKILQCWWIDGKPKCQVDDDYLYDNEVSTYLTIKIQKTTRVKRSTYSCWHAGSPLDPQKTCSLEIFEKDSVKDNSNDLAIGLSLALITVISATILVVILLRHNSCNLWRRDVRTSGEGEDHPMIVKESKEDEMTRMFQEYLVKSIEEMYQDTLDSFYFVPPIYFNKVLFKTQTIAGQVIYVPQPPDPSDLRHDRAMQHVLHCLHHMAERYKEQMFVLSQFKYEDYLNNPDHNFASHRLPVPVGQKGVKNVGCFDILIIHRHFGVLVGVVKSLSDKDDWREGSERKIDDELVSEVFEAVTQLKYAESMMQHLMSDQKQKPAVRMTLILPNVTLSSLQRALIGHSQVVQSLGECLNVKANDDPTHLCLCANHLSHPCAPWDVDTCAMSHLRSWWDKFVNQSDAGQEMTDELYRNIIARFCGPATVSGVKIADESTCQLPRTLQQTVSMTGQLFEKFTLFPGMTEMLEEPRMILSGPPGTGKSKTLALVGRKWISEGHVVCLINTWEEGSVANTKLLNLLQQTPTVQSSVNPTLGPFISVFCNIKDNKNIDKSVFFLKTHAKGKPLFALVDEPTFGKTKSGQVALFLQKLNESLPDLHMWVASCREDIAVPQGWRGKPLNVPFSCPPSVIREVWNNEDIAPYSSNTSLLPTDGLPVKNIHHRVPEHKAKEPRDCEACGKEIARFLTQTLHVTGPDTSNKDEDPVMDRQFATLQWKDILILFEKDVKKNVSMLKPLKESGFQVQVIDSNNIKNFLKINYNSVLAANVDFSCGLTRKVVVYVEGDINNSHSSAKWNRLFGVTKCTSQLVCVRMT